VKFVFDFAGVVFHWKPREMLRRVLPAHTPDEAGVDRCEAALFQGWGGDWAEFDRGTVDAPTLIQNISTRTGLSRSEVRAVVDAVPLELQPDPATLALIAALRSEGHALYFLSNMPAPYADHLEQRFPVVREFVDGVFSARVQAIKPEPAIFELAARRFGAEPAELLFFDDVAVNVAAAQAQGWNARQFASAEDTAAALRQQGWLR
jgi:putative hydrolase of the HAD superfamily